MWYVTLVDDNMDESALKSRYFHQLEVQKKKFNPKIGFKTF